MLGLWCSCYWRNALEQAKMHQHRCLRPVSRRVRKKGPHTETGPYLLAQALYPQYRSQTHAGPG